MAPYRSSALCRSEHRRARDGALPCCTVARRERLTSFEAHFEQHSFGLWAVEIPNVTSFAGFIGLSVPRFEAHFTPCVEIGWRLAAEYWGRGYASEGARAVLTLGFETLGLDEVVSFTAPGNLRSRRVMEKIGMLHNPADDFDHPALPVGHRLRHHVLYRMARPSLPNPGMQRTGCARR
jgi:RimJ/RimL family protein N-acetyltransferase